MADKPDTEQRIKDAGEALLEALAKREENKK